MEYKQRNSWWGNEMGVQSCFLCGNARAEELNMGGNELVHYIQCPNCGDYRISEQAKIDIDRGIYNKEVFPIVAGSVFDSFYYRNEVKNVLTEDFMSAKAVEIHEKLFKLAAYIHRETQKGNQRIATRNACCYSDNFEYSELLKELKRIGIIDFDECSSRGSHGTPTTIRMPPKLTMKGRINFEKGIDNVHTFKEVFYSMPNNPIITINNVNNSSGLIANAFDNAIINAIQNSGINELQTLFDNLIKSLPADLSKEKNDEVKENIDSIKAELQSLKPKKSLIAAILRGMNVITGTTEFLASLAAIAGFLGIVL
jgi:hypothetical protein